MYVVYPHWETGARNFRNLFSKLLILQNNQPPPCEAVPEPLLNNDGIVHLEKKTGVGCCVYQFSLSLFAPTTCLSWHGRRPILGPAGCPVRMASPKISSSQRWPFFAALPRRMFADPKKQLCLTRFHVTNLVFSVVFFPRWKNIK